jgi:hypothetical protein
MSMATVAIIVSSGSSSSSRSASGALDEDVARLESVVGHLEAPDRLAEVQGRQGLYFLIIVLI